MVKIDPKQSLLSTQLNILVLDLLCQSLWKNEGSFIENQTEIKPKDFIIKTDLDGFDDFLIVHYFSTVDWSNRIRFNLKLLTYNSKEVAHLEMIFNSDNVYEESFYVSTDELVTEQLLRFLKKNQEKITNNTFPLT